MTRSILLVLCALVLAGCDDEIPVDAVRVGDTYKGAPCWFQVDERDWFGRAYMTCGPYKWSAK